MRHLLLPLAIPLLVVLFGAARVVLRKVPVRWFEIVLAWVVAIVGVVIAEGGWQMYGSALVNIGHLAALAIAISPTIFLSLVLANRLVRQREASLTIMALTSLSAVLTVWLIPVLTIMLACSFTNDCL